MKNTIIYSCILVIGFFFSCKKEEYGVTPTAGKASVQLLSKVLIDNVTSDEFVYNDSGLVVQEKSITYLAINHYNSHGRIASSDFYVNDDILSSDAQVSLTASNSQALVSSSTGKSGGSVSCVYNGSGQLTRINYSQPSPGTNEYSLISYAGDKISRQTMYWGEQSTGYIDYAYSPNGNLISENLYNLRTDGVSELITTTTYDFDDKPNPFKSSSKLLLPGINSNNNNIVKETYTIHASAALPVDNITVTTSSYTYNASGYPSSRNGNVSFIYK